MTRFGLFAPTAVVLSCVIPGAALAVDWSDVPRHELVLFHPGQSSWEWLLTEHEGAKEIREGKDCLSCHDEEVREMGQRILSGETDTDLEPAEVQHAPFITATVQVAREADQLHMRLQWPKGERTSAGPQDETFATKAAVMIGDGSVVEYQRGGCWAACHADEKDMPHDRGLTKYLVQSRTAVDKTGGGKNLKPEQQLAELREGGTFLEYWQVGLTGGPPQATAASGHVLAEREEHQATAVEAKAQAGEGPQWTVVLSRPLRPDPAAPAIDLSAGDRYTLGFAIHTGHADGRFHYVSLPTFLSISESGAEFSTTSP